MLTMDGNLRARWTAERRQLFDHGRTKRRANIRHTSPLDSSAHRLFTLQLQLYNRNFVHNREAKRLRERAPDPAEFVRVQGIQHDFYLLFGIAEPRHKHVL